MLPTPLRVTALVSLSLFAASACKTQRDRAGADAKPSVVEITAADAGVVPARPNPAAAKAPELPRVTGPADYALDETGVAVHIPAGMVIRPSETEGFWIVETDDRRGRTIAQLMKTMAPENAKRFARDQCADQKNVRTKALAGGGVLARCSGSMQAVKIAGVDITTSKVRAAFPIAEEDRDDSWSGILCHHETNDKSLIELTAQVCGALHHVAVTHAVSPNAKDLKPGERCFRTSNCSSARGCERVECKYKSGTREKVCAVPIDHGAPGQGCGATRFERLLAFHPKSPSYVPASGRTIICNHEADNLYCDETSWECTPAAALGQRCDDDVPCVRDASCQGGRCVPSARPGESCATRRCVGDAFCDDAKVCRAYAAIGAACTPRCRYGCTNDTCTQKYDPGRCEL